MWALRCEINSQVSSGTEVRHPSLLLVSEEEVASDEVIEVEKKWVI